MLTALLTLDDPPRGEQQHDLGPGPPPSRGGGGGPKGCWFSRIPKVELFNSHHVSPKSDKERPFRHEQRRSLAGFGRTTVTIAQLDAVNSNVEVLVPSAASEGGLVPNCRFVRHMMVRQEGCQRGLVKAGPLLATLLWRPPLTTRFVVISGLPPGAHNSLSHAKFSPHRALPPFPQRRPGVRTPSSSCSSGSTAQMAVWRSARPSGCGSL